MELQDRSTVRVVLALAALLIGGGLTWWLVEAQQPKVQDLTAREVPYEAPAVTLKTSRVDPGPEQPKPPAGAVLRVRVLDDETGHAIARAQVSLVRSPEGLGDDAPVDWGDVVSTLTTDAVGQVDVPRPAGVPGSALRVVASGLDHLRTVRTVGDAPMIELRLRTGAKLAGIAVDLAGNPLAGVTILARHLGSREAAAHDARSLRWGLQEATTDARGRFAFHGLARCAYSLDCAADGLAIAREAESGDPLCQLVYAAGAQEEARLVLQPIRVLAVRFLDGSHDPAPPLTLDHRDLGMFVVPGEGVSGGDPLRRIQQPVFDGAGWVRLARPARDPALYHGVVRLTEAETPAGIQMLFDVHGYRPARATVRLWRPSELRSLASVDEIRLEPQHESTSLAGGARVLVREHRPHPAFFDPTWRQLAVTLRPDFGGMYRGERQQDGRWLFAHLPEGQADLALFDGGAFSEKRRVNLRAGETIEIELGFVGVTGLSLDVRDAKGRRLFDMDHIVVYHDPKDAGPTATLAREVSLGDRDPNTGRARYPRIAFKPGRYSVSVMKLGYGWANTSFEIKEGTITVADLFFSEALPDVADRGGEDK